MLSIRMQRRGRKGYATYRVVVQDSRQAPTSGKFVALIGNYNPHTKETNLEKEKVEHFLKNGAQPSDRVVKLLEKEGYKLPSWVKKPTEGSRDIRNPEKLRKNRPAEEKPAEASEEPAAEPAEAEAPVEESSEQKTEEPKAEEKAEAESEEAK